MAKSKNPCQVSSLGDWSLMGMNYSVRGALLDAPMYSRHTVYVVIRCAENEIDAHL